MAGLFIFMCVLLEFRFCIIPRSWNSILPRSFFNISNFRFIAGVFTFTCVLLEFLSVFFYTAEIPFFRVHFLVHFLTLATFVSLLEFLHLYAYCWNFFLLFFYTAEIPFFRVHFTLLKFRSSTFYNSRPWYYCSCSSTAASLFKFKFMKRSRSQLPTTRLHKDQHYAS